MLATGYGVSQDNRFAYKWLSLAAQGGHKDAVRTREALARKLSVGDRRSASNQAAHFFPQANLLFADKPTVMYVQYVLNQLGFSAGVVDGIPGRRTQAAIKAYQRANDLSVDGEILPSLVDSLIPRSMNLA